MEKRALGSPQLDIKLNTGYTVHHDNVQYIIILYCTVLKSLLGSPQLDIKLNRKQSIFKQKITNFSRTLDKTKLLRAPLLIGMANLILHLCSGKAGESEPVYIASHLKLLGLLLLIQVIDQSINQSINQKVNQSMFRGKFIDYWRTTDRARRSNRCFR